MIRPIIIATFISCSSLALAAEIPEQFPRFVVPGHEEAMAHLRELFFLHYPPATRPPSTMWDDWLTISALWPAVEPDPKTSAARGRWRAALLARRIDASGYVSSHQHLGLAHNDGWPFPLWTQAGGIGWAFSVAGQPSGYGAPQVTNVDNWELHGAKSLGIDNERGWKLELTAAASLTTPAFDVDSFVAPFIRLAWRASGLPGSERPYLEWATTEHPDFSPQRRMYFSSVAESDGLVFTHIPVHTSPAWKGRISRLRLSFDNPPGAQIAIRSLITAVDSRHNINNSRFVEGCTDFVRWTGDLTFLRENIHRMRLALRYAMDEFDTGRQRCVVTRWVGHDGRSGLEVGPDGQKTIHRGRGVGNNYWDLLPFGGKDALATIYYFDAVRCMAELERQIAAHPEWNIPAGPLRLDPDDLSRHAQDVKNHAGELFWNPESGRFVAAIDLDGTAYDYGYTFVNCEAIYYDFATQTQARSILDWLSGKRLVDGDTSQAEDIYHWRFAPRASTKRNVTYYVWAWSGPETIPWGGQVQDGGAVLGFSYHDLMARLATSGPDDAWRRLAEIIDWFAEVQAEGGYRAYYKVPGRGTLQGGNVPGGLGLDLEFLESVLVPQVMLYGFMGFEPRMDGFTIDPRLPEDWPELTITRIHFHGLILDLTASDKTIRITAETDPREALTVFPPPGQWRIEWPNATGKPPSQPITVNIQESKQAISWQPEHGRILVLTRL